MLIRPDRYLWDFWTAWDETTATYHLFCLTAPRTGNPSGRHDQARIGHATSQDLRNWEWTGDVLVPDSPGHWDDLSLWTGSVIRRENRWWLFYTGRDRERRAQQVGVAVSEDCTRWERFKTGPILAPDPHWYTLPEEEPPTRYTWRDPYVVRDPATRTYYLFIAAHDRHQPPGYQGAIGVATSDNLVDWVWQRPAVSPGYIQDIEVPTVIRYEGAWYLWVSVKREWFHPQSPLDSLRTGLLVYRSETLSGPWRLVEPRPLDVPEWYAARPVQTAATESYVLMGWRRGAEEGAVDEPLSYTIDDPRPIIWRPDGTPAIGPAIP